MAGRRMRIKVKLYGGRGLSEDPQEARWRLGALSSFPSEAGVCEAWFWSGLRSTEPGSRRPTAHHTPSVVTSLYLPRMRLSLAFCTILMRNIKKANYNKDPADSGGGNTDAREKPRNRLGLEVVNPSKAGFRSTTQSGDLVAGSHLPEPGPLGHQYGVGSPSLRCWWEGPTGTF